MLTDLSRSRWRWLARRRLVAFLLRFSLEDLLGLSRYLESGRPVVFADRALAAPGWKGAQPAWDLVAAMRNPAPGRGAPPAPAPESEHTSAELLGLMRSRAAGLTYLDLRQAAGAAVRKKARGVGR